MRSTKRFSGIFPCLLAFFCLCIAPVSGAEEQQRKVLLVHARALEEKYSEPLFFPNSPEGKRL